MKWLGSKRFTLADLAFATVWCGLIMAVGRSGAFDPLIVGALLAATTVIWLFFRLLRGRPSCVECGGRFTPEKALKPVLDCGTCGAKQAKFARSYRRVAITMWAMVPLIPLLGLGGLGFVAVSLGSGEPPTWVQIFAMPIAALGIIVVGLGIVRLEKVRDRLAKTEGRTCESCGADLERPPSPLVCPSCLSRRHKPTAATLERAKDFRHTILGFIMLAIPAGAILFAVGRLTLAYGGRFGLVVVVVGGLGCVYLVAQLVVFLIKSQRINAILHEDAAISRARVCAGEQGRITRDGPSTIWYTGPDDPTAKLLETHSAARRRFEALLGIAPAGDPARLMLCFHDEKALKTFHSWVMPSLVSSRPLQGFYLQPPWDTLTLCTGEFSTGPGDPWIVASSLHNQALVERTFGTIRRHWLRIGLNSALGLGECQDLSVLSRRMVVAISSGQAWTEDLFTISDLKLTRLLKRSEASLASLKADLLAEQSWSIVEYLLGEHSPQSRHVAFLAFLKDKTSGVGSEDSFFRHFGFGYGTLLESWREWVNAQGIGPDPSPPPGVREVIVNHILPLLRDTTAPRKTRIEALREWGREGYILGADSVIELLRDPGAIPKAEIEWALAMVSGRTLGDDPDRWQAWWDETPRDSGPPPTDEREEARSIKP